MSCQGAAIRVRSADEVGSAKRLHYGLPGVGGRGLAAAGWRRIAETVAFEDGGVVEEPVHGGTGHERVAKEGEVVTEGVETRKAT